MDRSTGLVVPPPKMVLPGHLKPECVIRDQLSWHRENLRLWENGFLTPTEPDEEERRITVAELKAAIATLEWVLGDDK